MEKANAITWQSGKNYHKLAGYINMHYLGSLKKAMCHILYLIDLPIQKLGPRVEMLKVQSVEILLSRTQAGPGRKFKQEQEDISPSHVPSF